MKSIARAAAALLFLATAVFARYHELVWDHEKICSTLLERAKAGEVSPKRINYEALRLNCARTSWYLDREKDKIRELSEKMHKAAYDGKYERAKQYAASILELDYLDMWAQKIFSQSMLALGEDSVVANRHREFRLELLGALVNSGTRKSCKNGWVVIDVDEEYFVMNMAGWRPKRQQLVNEDGHTCDLMKVEDEDGREFNVYFNVDVVFENYRRAMVVPKKLLELDALLNLQDPSGLF
ncbi:MAG: DUF4919 domain-containing protein [Fibrobacterales bacterium]|nr:DUF4919 domain-containing protein [Fibrobacterales bacterium]